MNACILDAGAIIALLSGEKGASVVDDILTENIGYCYIHAANLCEVYYGIFRAHSREYALSALEAIYSLGIQSRKDLDADFWQDAGQIKAIYRRVSLADCYGLALTRRMNGEFITTDRHELTVIQSAALCPIRFVS